MQVAENQPTVRSVVRAWRRDGDRIALVPTMGNLHEGHLALVHAARRHADRVVTSIFVNPTQFGEGEDFQRYPRTPDEDLAALEAEGCDLVFVPDAKEIYPFGLERAVLLKAPPDLAGRLEGRTRPGHFDGVVTVVARLFAIVGPDVAVFGEKDYQQLLVIRRLSEDLGFGIDVIGEQTIRDTAGLALSSRNAYLDAEKLAVAQKLNQILARTGRLVGSSSTIGQLESDAAEQLARAGFRVDYVAIRRADDLSAPEKPGERLRILAAVWCGQIRLIDNMAVPAGA